MTIAYRAAELADAEFIVPLWSRAFKTSRSAGMIASEDWARVMHPQIQKLLNRPGVRTIVAYENTDPKFLYGFITGNTAEVPPTVHFCYVKEYYRRAGYARGLFAALGVDPSRSFSFTCWTPICAKLTQDQRDEHGVPIPQTAKLPFARHNPNLARYAAREGTPHGHDEDPR
jgi:hypothetical protein